MKVELIIPKNDNDGSDNSAVIRDAVAHMCNKFGGATVYDANGFWTNNEGHLYQDAVSVIVSAATDKVAAKAAAHALARKVLEITDQEAVFVAVGDDAEIIE